MNISSGHWHVGTGAVGLIDEVTEARKVAKEVAQLLYNKGIQVRLIMDNTSTNQRENIEYLLKEHNRVKGLNISIHFNAVKGLTEKGIGTEVLYKNEHMKQLASNIAESVYNVSGLNNRGAKQRTDLAILNGLLDAIIIEVCFVNSVKDVALYHKHFHRICQAIASELLNIKMPTYGISSPSLLKRVNDILQSEKLIKEVLEKGVKNGVFHSIWLDRFKRQQLAPNDFLGLCTLLVINNLND